MILLASKKMTPLYFYLKIHPKIGDKTIITTENVNEFIDIKVALCSDGIILLRTTSVRISIKLSENDPIQAPTIIRYGFLV